MKNMFDYYASQSTSEGFVSYFDSVFSPDKLERLYVVIGGSGSGKSTLMRKAAEYFSKNHRIELFHCSADPKSLDGVIIDGRIGLADGTPPHSIVPRFPGAFEKIVNTGDCWDCQLLFDNRESIRRLIIEKASIYARAYRYLQAAGEIEDERQSILLSAVLQNKMRKAAKRTISNILSQGKGYSMEIRPMRALGAQGEVFASGFADEAKKVIAIADDYSIGYLYLNALIELSADCGGRYISYSAIGKERPDAIFFNEDKVLFKCVGKKELLNSNSEHFKIINMERFIDKKSISENRNKLKFSAKCRDALKEGAVSCFTDAAYIHSQIEDYYVSAMDFEKCSELADETIKTISKLLK